MFFLDKKKKSIIITDETKGGFDMETNEYSAELLTIQHLWENQSNLTTELKNLRYASRKLEKYPVNKEISMLRKRISKLDYLEEVELKEEAKEALQELIEHYRYNQVVISYLDYFEMVHMTKELLEIVMRKLQEIPHEHEYWLVNPTAKKRKQQFICPFCGKELEAPVEEMKQEIYEGEMGQKLYQKKYMKRQRQERTKS